MPKVSYYTILIPESEIPDLKALCKAAERVPELSGQLSGWLPRGDKIAFAFRDQRIARYFMVACRNIGLPCEQGPEWGHPTKLAQCISFYGSHF